MINCEFKDILYIIEKTLKLTKKLFLVAFFLTISDIRHLCSSFTNLPNELLYKISRQLIYVEDVKNLVQLNSYYRNQQEQIWYEFMQGQFKRQFSKYHQLISNLPESMFASSWTEVAQIDYLIESLSPQISIQSYFKYNETQNDMIGFEATTSNAVSCIGFILKPKLVKNNKYKSLTLINFPLFWDGVVDNIDDLVIYVKIQN